MHLKYIIRNVRCLFLRGKHFYCPICKNGFRKFLAFGVIKRPNACCPACGSLERHRLLWIVIDKLRHTGIIKNYGKMLHVAPEQCLADIFIKEYEYVSIDLDKEKAMLAMDLSVLAFKDKSFDAIVCNHVLEHILDDKKAINELYRVLKPGGWASIQVPISGDVTQENLFITDPKERQRLYGLEDHVRSYGKDFALLLRDAGFKVSQILKNDLLGDNELSLISVGCETEVLIATRH